MDMDLRGRLGHTTLPKSNYLLPVFEAIINSIHAIEDAGVSDGWVKIEIVRDRTQKVLKDGEKTCPTEVRPREWLDTERSLRCCVS